MLVLLISEFPSNNMHLELPSYVIHTLARILKYFVREEKQQVYDVYTKVYIKIKSKIPNIIHRYLSSFLSYESRFHVQLSPITHIIISVSRIQHLSAMQATQKLERKGEEMR